MSLRTRRKRWKLVDQDEEGRGETEEDNISHDEENQEETEMEGEEDGDDDDDVTNKKKYYIQKFRKEWLMDPTFKAWLSRSEDSDDKAYCVVCKTELCAHKSDLIRHNKGKKHQKKMEAVAQGTSTITSSSSSIHWKSSGPLESRKMQWMETLVNQDEEVGEGEEKDNTSHEEECLEELEKEGEEDRNDDAQDHKYHKDNVKKRYYIQKFRKEWLTDPTFQAWLSRSEDSDDKAYCVVCKTELCAHKFELVRHSKGKKHQKKMKAVAQGTSTITSSSSNIHIESSVSESLELSTVLDEDGVSHVLYIIDLRSDTVTQPCREMKSAMVNAALGDDAFSEDPTVKSLEEKVAKLLEKEAALFVPSGTMANLVCVMAHCWHRGAEVVVGDQSNLHVWAQGSIAQIAGIRHRIVKNQPDGTFSLKELQVPVRNSLDHWPSLTLVCVENTHNILGGKVLPIHWLDELGTVCSQLGVLVHCDGARLMNAAVALDTSPARLVQSCDSVSLCLNKGLGAPMGSVIAGTKDFIGRALRMRKALGGGLHQGGMLAAAGLWALDHQVPKLSMDHVHARAIAQCVEKEHSSAITVDLESVQTNIVLLHCDNIRVDAKKFCQRLASVTEPEAEELGKKIVVMMKPVSDTCVQLMTHCNARIEHVKAVIKKLKYVIQEYDNAVYLEYKINV